MSGRLAVGRLAGNTVPQDDAAGYPAYRME